MTNKLLTISITSNWHRITVTKFKIWSCFSADSTTMGTTVTPDLSTRLCLSFGTNQQRCGTVSCCSDNCAITLAVMFAPALSQMTALTLQFVLQKEMISGNTREETGSVRYFFLLWSPQNSGSSVLCSRCHDDTVAQALYQTETRLQWLIFKPTGPKKQIYEYTPPPWEPIESPAHVSLSEEVHNMEHHKVVGHCRGWVLLKDRVRK